MSEPFYTEAGATFGDERRYRYSLWRIWNPDLPRVCFVMLNPSTADETVLDPTLRRCLAFAVSWGYGSFEIGNLFALRSTSPRALFVTGDPVGPDNDRALATMAEDSALIVCAWGVNGRTLDRDVAARTLLSKIRPLHHLRLTKDGYPSHPLYLPSTLKPRPWSGTADKEH